MRKCSTWRRILFRNFLIRNMATVTECYVEPLGRGYKRVILPHKQVVYLGRNRDTSILDRLVSKNQLSLTADYERQIVECVQLGTNLSGYNGYAISKGTTYAFTNGDKIEVVLGKFLYEVVFELVDISEITPRKKQKVDSNAERNIPDDFDGNWQFIDNSLLLYTPNVDTQGTSIAAFDLDGTLITTKSGQRFPKDTNDWVLAFPNVQKTLKDLYLEGYRIIIFSNQHKLGYEKHLIPSFKTKIDNIIHKIGVPIQVFIATQRDMYRKPLIGMWNSLLKLMNETVDMQQSFYVGDAAGREKNWAPHKKKDHSMSDRLFAINIGINFYTPEEYFLKARSVKFLMPEFDPRAVTSYDGIVPLSKDPEAILMVGCQGSGKSHFCKKHLIPRGYVYINRDSLGSKQKCLNTFEDCLKTQKSVVVDNTNPDIDSRKPYVDLCKRSLSFDKEPMTCFAQLRSSFSYSFTKSS
ncbi:hypothetical protein Trydic_g3465 [Trypoxylus dichotomus]